MKLYLRDILLKEVDDTIDNNIILLAQHIMKVFNNNSHILGKLSSKVKQTSELLLPIIGIRDLFIKRLASGYQ